MADTLSVERDGPVATITVDNPERLNALDLETLRALEDALAETQDARAVVLSGAGETAFVAGADISYMIDLSVAEAHEYAESAAEIGLVGEVVSQGELDSVVSELAKRLADQPRFALSAEKEALNQVHELPQSAGLAYERRLWSDLFGTPDQREGMSAFVEERDPEFE